MLLRSAKNLTVLRNGKVLKPKVTATKKRNSRSVDDQQIQTKKMKLSQESLTPTKTILKKNKRTTPDTSVNTKKVHFDVSTTMTKSNISPPSQTKKLISKGSKKKKLVKSEGEMFLPQNLTVKFQQLKEEEDDEVKKTAESLITIRENLLKVEEEPKLECEASGVVPSDEVEDKKEAKLECEASGVVLSDEVVEENKKEAKLECVQEAVILVADEKSKVVSDESNDEKANTEPIDVLVHDETQINGNIVVETQLVPSELAETTQIEFEETQVVPRILETELVTSQDDNDLLLNSSTQREEEIQRILDNNNSQESITQSL